MNIINTNAANVTIRRYLRLFAFVYFCASIVGDLLIIYFEIDRNIGLSLGMLMASAFITGAKFVMDKKRCPEKEERQKLIWGSLLLSIVISVIVPLLMIYVNVGLEGIKSLAALLAIPQLYWIIAVAIMTLVYWIVLTLSYGWGVKKFADTQNLSENAND